MKIPSIYNSIIDLDNGQSIIYNAFRKSLSSAVLLLGPFLLSASSYDVVVTDIENQSLQDVTISILAEQDSTIIQSGLTDRNGKIVVPDNLRPQDILLIHHPNYETVSLMYSERGDTLKLTPLTKDLNEFVVLGNKDQIRAEAGKIIFTPGDLKTKVTTAFDLMKYAPLITEDNEIFKVLDKAAYILVDGMDPQVPQQQILAELRAASPSIIKSIEIRPNPGSEYSASSNIGIININLVDRRNGFWASARIDGGIGDNFFSDRDALNIFFSKGRFRISAYGSFLMYRLGKQQSNIYEYGSGGKNEDLIVRNDFQSKRRAYNAGGYLYMSYDLTKNSKIGGGVSLYALKNNDTYTTESKYFRSDGTEDASTSISRYVRPWSKPQLDYKLYYILNTDNKGSRLEVSGLYSHGNMDANTYYDFAPDKNEHQGNRDKGGAAVANYTQVFSSNQTLKGGYSFNTTNHTDISKTSLQDYSFDYKETIHAAYLQLESLWGKGFSSSLGLRLESDKIKGAISNGSLLYNRNETELFPSLTLNYSLPSGNHYWMLNVARRIHRPQFYDLNPYILWTSENTCVAGNPDLKSSLYWDISLMYMFHSHYMLNLYCSFDKDSNMMFDYGENGISFSTRINRPKSQYYSITFEFNKDLLKFWRFKSNLYLNYSYAPFIFHDKDLTQKSFGVNCKFQNNFAFPGKYIPNIDFNGQIGYQQQNVGSGSHVFLNTKLAFYKEIIPNLNAEISVAWSALSKINVKTYLPDYIKEVKDRSFPVTGYFSFTYTFGNSRLRRYQDAGDTSYKNRF